MHSAEDRRAACTLIAECLDVSIRRAMVLRHLANLIAFDEFDGPDERYGFVEAYDTLHAQWSTKHKA